MAQRPFTDGQEATCTYCKRNFYEANMSVVLDDNRAQFDILTCGLDNCLNKTIEGAKGRWQSMRI